jgi:transcriptional regulator with XRE-family HTH domain
LGLSKEESQYIELKLSLSQALAERRKKSKLTQAQLAKMLKSSQSRVARMERGDPTVSVDLLVKFHHPDKHFSMPYRTAIFEHSQETEMIANSICLCYPIKGICFKILSEGEK